MFTIDGVHSCSISCFKIHKENHPPEEAPKPAGASTKVPEPVKKQDRHPFSVLDNSVELRRLFNKYPNLSRRLKKIHEATLPPRGEGITKGGLPWKLPSTEHRGKKEEPWTREVGLRRGRDALRKARVDPNEDGDAVREYCETVLYLLSKAENRDATELVRQEVAKGDAEFVERLMEMEQR